MVYYTMLKVISKVHVHSMLMFATCSYLTYWLLNRIILVNFFLRLFRFNVSDITLLYSWRRIVRYLVINLRTSLLKWLVMPVSQSNAWSSKPGNRRRGSRSRSVKSSIRVSKLGSVMAFTFMLSSAPTPTVARNTRSHCFPVFVEKGNN